MPGPLDLCARFLEAEGAVVERVAAGVEAVVPPDLGRALGLRDEFVRLTEGSAEDRDAVPVGYGSALLERVLGLATDGVAVAWADAVGSAANQAVGALALERFDFLNASVVAGAETASEGNDWAWWFRYAIEADERAEGMLVVGISAGGAPLRGIADALADPHRLRGSQAPRDTAEAIREVERLQAVARAEALARLTDPVTAFVRGVSRRHARDRRRIETYYRDLIAEMRRDLERRLLSTEGIERREAKIAATARDRVTKLVDLEEKYAVRVTLSPVAVLGLKVGRRTCTLTVRRRSQQFQFPVQYDGLVQDFDPVRCACCGASTHAIGFCDAKLHVLCRSCLGRTGGAGRRGCPACVGQRPEDPAVRFRREFESLARREGFPVEEATDGTVRDHDRKPPWSRAPARPAPRPDAPASRAIVQPAETPPPPEPTPKPAPPPRSAPTPEPALPPNPSPPRPAPSSNPSPASAQYVQGSLFDQDASPAADASERVLALIEASPGLRAEEVSRLLDLPPEVVKPLLRDLVARGQILRTGVTRGTRYFPPPRDREG